MCFSKYLQIDAFNVKWIPRSTVGEHFFRNTSFPFHKVIKRVYVLSLVEVEFGE